MTLVGRGGGVNNPQLNYCKDVFGAQNLYILGHIAYIFHRGVDASEASLSKKALIPTGFIRTTA